MILFVFLLCHLQDMTERSEKYIDFIQVKRMTKILNYENDMVIINNLI